MYVEQIYTGCLAQGAYYIESNGEAVVIDPLREVSPYLKRAEKDNATIKYVFETHFHADFVSGHIDLAEKTGAAIVYGPTAQPDFKAHIAADGEEFRVGALTFKAIHTPGHTLESTCYLLKNEEGKEVALFTGDTLFIGDVGRPDLAQKLQSDLTQEKLAGLLYDSLREKILPLPDSLIIYPAHGAGSACGKNMSKETTDTLGHQKEVNYALQPMTKEAFIKAVTEGLTQPPLYFPENVRMNSKGYDSIDTVLGRGLQALSPEAFERLANESGAVLLDTRDAEVFARGFIPNSINIGVDGSFAPWVGALIPDVKQPLLLITETGREEEVVTRLARVGYDYALGYLRDGFDAWLKAGKETDRIESVAAAEIAPDAEFLDVRKENEYDTGHVEGALNVPLDYINEQLHKISKDRTYYIHCAGGYRSMVFASILKSRGYEHIVNVQGGFKALKEARKFDLA